MPVLDLEEALRQWLLAFSLSLPRLLIAFTILPLLSAQVLPGMTRNAVLASMALVVLPVIAAQAPSEPPSALVMIAIVIKETFIGIVIGYTAAILFWAVESIGFFIDNHRGATMASSLDPMTGDQTSPLGVLLTQVMTVLFFIGGGFLIFLGGLYESYRSWPVFSFYPEINLQATGFFLAQLDLLMYLTVFLAGPVITAMFLSEFGLALISRFAPQLNVFFLSMPIKSGVATFILTAYIAVLIYFFEAQFRQIGTLFPKLSALLQ